MSEHSGRKPIGRNSPRRRRISALAISAIVATGLVFWSISNTVLAQTSLRIAAIVNDEIISGFDLESRLRLVMMSSRLPNHPEVQRRFRPQILRNLVEERLRMQEAKRIGIKISRHEIQQAVTDLERRNNIPAGTMAKLLSQNGLDTLALEKRLESELAWSRVVRRRVRASADVNQEDVETEITRIEADKGKPEYLISEIFLQPTSDQSNNQIQKFARRVVQQVRSGASFSALATTISLSASASLGGDMGWVRPDQLDPKVAKRAVTLGPGDISEPILATDGIYIVQLRDRRVSPGLGAERIRISLRSYLQPVKKDSLAAELATLKSEIKLSFEAANNCTDFDHIAKDLKDGRAGKLTDVRLSSLAPNMRTAIHALPPGKSSSIIQIENKLLVLMVCSRKVENTRAEVRKRVRQIILERRAELISRRILRNLRRQAFVDIRS